MTERCPKCASADLQESVEGYCGEDLVLSCPKRGYWRRWTAPHGWQSWMTSEPDLHSDRREEGG